MIQVLLQFTKKTKRTFRFDSVDQPGKPPEPVSSIYIDQSAFLFKEPKCVRITVEADPASEV